MKSADVDDGDFFSASNSPDHRTVTFRNSTGVWVRLEATMQLGRTAVRSRAIVAPYDKHDWKFLGERETNSCRISNQDEIWERA